MSQSKSRPPGENYRILEEILDGTSLSDIPISTIGGDCDEDGRPLSRPMTREEFDRRYKQYQPSGAVADVMVGVKQKA